MGANTRDAPALSGLLLGGRRRRRSSLPQLIKQAPNDAAPVVFSDLLFDTPVSGAYTLTCLGGSYSLTGSNANITFVGIKPEVISTTTLVLGTSATPGAQAITVPADAQVVVVTSRNYSASGVDLSLTSNFTGTFTTTQDSNGGTERTTVSHAVVSSTGSKTITPVWTNAPAEGPLFFITFIKNVNTSDYYRASDAIALDSTGSTASRTVASTANDLVLALESHYDAGQAIPGTVSGWTSISTQGNNSEGGRLSTADSPGASTTTFTGGSTSYDGVSIIAIKPNVGGAYTLTAQGGSYTLTGSSAVLKRSKYLAASGGSYTLTGAQAVITYTPTAANYSFILSGGSYTLTGASATLSRNRKLTASGGAYTISGANATLLRSKRITANGGSYTVSGASANLRRSHLLVAQGGVYTYTGQQVTITYTAGAINYTLTCNGGSYVVNGASAVLSRNRKLTASSGSYSVTGASAILSRNKKLTASGGSYTVTGGTATLLRSKVLTLQGGSYNLTGASTTLLRSKVLVASGGVYSLAGQSAILSRNRMLVALSGSYSYQGSSAIITKTSAGGYPAEEDVLLGVVYGASGEYTGTLDIGKKFRIDIATGNIVMIIDEGKVMSL